MDKQLREYLIFTALEEGSKLVCERCGGTNIETIAWVDPNTNEFKCIFEGDAPIDNWCNDCEDHVNFVYNKDFKPNKDEK